MAVGYQELRGEAEEVGFREGRDWLFSPEPLRLSGADVAQLERLGHPLRMFQQGCDRIYRRSVKGSLPGWIAELLDAGKPARIGRGPCRVSGDHLAKEVQRLRFETVRTA